MMKTTSHAKMLGLAAKRAQTRPQYLGWILAQYASIEGLSEADIARLLKISIPNLIRLELCLSPRRDHFTVDLQQVSTKFNLDLLTMAQIVRLVDSLSVMRTTKADSKDSGILMAARARKGKKKLHQEKEKDSRGKRSKS